MTNVELRELSKIYPGGVIGAEDVTLTIEEGEFVTLVGPSGSGKSTVLRMIAGLVSPTGGRIMFEGRDITDVPPQERDIAMVFQNYALYPNMTVRENMSFGLKMRGEPKPERLEKVEETAEMLQIEELLDREIQQLSGGQQQRVALGRSIVREPKVFLLDEPLANLDAKLRVEMRANLMELQRKLDITTVYVTHNQLEALTMSDRVAVMNDGQIQQVAEPQTLFNQPNNTFVADFIGTPSMNFINCEVKDGSDSIVLDTDIFEIRMDADLDEVREVTKNGNEYVLGVRPQHTTVHRSDGHTPGNTVEMEVAVVETAGDEFIVHLDTDRSRSISEEDELIEERFTVVVDEDVDLTRGDTVAVEFKPDKIHLFDRSTGKAVW